MLLSVVINSFTINAGIQARFRLSQRFDLNLEYGGIILDSPCIENFSVISMKRLNIVAGIIKERNDFIKEGNI